MILIPVCRNNLLMCSFFRTFIQLKPAQTPDIQRPNLPLFFLRMIPRRPAFCRLVVVGADLFFFCMEKILFVM